jgi:uncharacterized protein YjbJ (UPF0337 family)
MNKDIANGQWNQLKGQVRKQWGKLTDDDIAQINGNREQLEGKIQARYGYARHQVMQHASPLSSGSMVSYMSTNKELGHAASDAGRSVA